MIHALGALAEAVRSVQHLEDVIHSEQLDTLQHGTHEQVTQLEVARLVALAAWSELLGARRAIERVYQQRGSGNGT